mgnify:CR=1 FL=1
MKLLAAPFLRLVWRTAELRRGAISCVALSLIASATEIFVAMSLVPILASLGVGAGGELGGFVGRFPPATWLFLFVVAAGVRSTVNWWSSMLSQRNTQALVVSLQSRLYRALAGAHWDAVRRVSPPTITNALQTQTYEVGYGFSDMVQVVSAVFLVTGYVAASIFVFPVMLPVLLLLLISMWLFNVRRNSRVLAQSEDYMDAQTGLHQRYEDWVAISRISSLGVDAGKLADSFESNARDAASHAVGYSRSSAATRLSYEAAVVAAILVGVPIAWWLKTPPALLAFGLVLFVRVLPRAGSIQIGYQGVVNAVAPANAVERLAIQLERDPARHATSRTPLTWQRLELADVGIEDTQRDEGQNWILSETNVEVRHGDWLALTGPTGAGKTTLAEVMLMLVRPDAGEIRIDDQVVDEKLASLWRDQAAYVPQDVVLFDASIRDNLRLYVPEATDDELEDALSKSAADFVMTRLPEGLDTRTGPGGRWLSGGERQRIGIARALLRKPGFLVLDEPTAALDSVTQEKLMDALSDLDHKMSVVFITHRPELLRLADKIIGIEDGRITRRDDGFRRSDPAVPRQ